MSGSGTGTPAAAVSTSLTVAWRRDAPFILERVSDPDIEPITLAEMKVHLRCFDSVTDEDAEITGLISGAREWAEEFTGRALIDQTWRITINTSWPVGGDAVSGYTTYPGYCGAGWSYWQRCGEILLRKSPVLAITSFASADTAGIETAVDPATWGITEPDSKWPRIALLDGATWSGSALKVEFRAGYADRLGSPQQGGEMVPARIIQAMKLWCDAMYDRDDKTMEMLLTAAENLLKPERTEMGMA